MTISGLPRKSSRNLYAPGLASAPSGEALPGL
jgi:hypothetical protein